MRRDGTPSLSFWLSSSPGLPGRSPHSRPRPISLGLQQLQLGAPTSPPEPRPRATPRAVGGRPRACGAGQGRGAGGGAVAALALGPRREAGPAAGEAGGGGRGAAPPPPEESPGGHIAELSAVAAAPLLSGGLVLPHRLSLPATATSPAPPRSASAPLGGKNRPLSG